MYKPVKFITNVPYRGFSTYYLFDKSEKILIPVEIDTEIKNKATPTIYNSIKRIINATGYSFLCIKIYKSEQNIFYTYLSICGKDKLNKVLDINISFEDGIEISKENNVPIFINETILKRLGFVITKRIVEKALLI